MTIYEVLAIKKPITATIEMPASKSYTNRALIMAALTKGPVSLHHPLYSEDTLTMITCLKDLGLHIETLPNQIIVHDDISVIQNNTHELFVKDSGTTFRFLLALLCLTPGTKVIRGNDRLNERPIKDLVDVLRLLGAKIEYLEKAEQAPLKIHPSILHSKQEVTIDASLSSQFVSALLMISPYLDELKLNFRNTPISRPYINMTIQTMRQWGIKVLDTPNNGFHVPSGQTYTNYSYNIEGDFSSAGYFFAIGALTQSTITLKNLNPHSYQADKNLLRILACMGNKIQMDEQRITIRGKGVLPMVINMEDCPDQVQTMAVMAAFAKGKTTISGVRSLRVKETERVKALKTELKKMGISTEDTHDTLTIYGGNPHAAAIDTYGDHRMAMAFAIAGTKLSGMKIRHPEVVNKTFPLFWEKLRECS